MWGPKVGRNRLPARASSDPAVQIGMPDGLQRRNDYIYLAANGVASLWDYSQVNLNTVLNLDAPEFHITYAQVQLLLAEAAVRGWVAGTAADYFAKGIRANWSRWPPYESPVPEATIKAYLDAHPLDAGKALEQINTQYWVASFLDGNEAWANFRRSGFPALKKNPYPGSEIKGDFIRRLPYPDSEIVVNSGKLNEAITRQGPNTSIPACGGISSQVYKVFGLRLWHSILGWSDASGGPA